MAIRIEVSKSGKKTYSVYCDGRDARGKRIQLRRRGMNTEREAKAVEFELKRQIANSKDKSPCYTWDEWFQICVERMRLELKPSTVMEYQGKNIHWIQPFIGSKLLKDITPQDIHEVVYNTDFDVTWYTRRGTLRRINRIFQLAVDEGLVPSNPAVRIRVKVPEGRKAVLNKNEIDKLLYQARLGDHRFYEIWVLAILTGMRSGELYALEWDDVNFEQGMIWVRRSWTSKNGFGTTKNSRSRVVPISDELRQFLTALKLKRENSVRFVLPRLGEWDRGNQAQVLKDFCEGIGITPVRFHDLRATFITQMLSKGVSLAHVMAIVGHSEIKTTQGYLRLAGLELKGATEALGINLPRLQDAKVFQFPT